MTSKKPTYDVFLSYAPGDISWVQEVEDRFVSAGLSVYNQREANQREAVISEHMEDVVWEAMAESYALVVLLADGPTKPLLLSFLVGAAMGGQKPVYVVYQGTFRPKVPAYGELFKAEQLDKVIDQVKKLSRRFLDRDRKVLIDSYISTGATVHELLSEPQELDRLTHSFHRAAKSSIAGEHLLREILRLRKRGELPRLRRQHA